MIIIDGSFGEGGGQILRTAIALSLVTGQAFQIKNIRASRKKPGLMQQHLTAVNAAARIGAAEVKGNEIGSKELAFSPTAVYPGTYHFDVGTAGSATLVFQTVLPALLTASGISNIVLEGGTHNPFAPPFDFLSQAFIPVINRMGANVSVFLERPGFYPAGGGKFTVSITPAEMLIPLDFLTCGNIVSQRAKSYISKLVRSIAERELKVVQDKLGLDRRNLEVVEVENPKGPGNALIIEIKSENITEVFSGFGARGVSAERVAEQTVKEVEKYLAADVPVGKYLADQLLIPMAIARGGRFRTLAPTLHTLTNAEIVKKFLNIDIEILEISKHLWEVRIG